MGAGVEHGHLPAVGLLIVAQDVNSSIAALKLEVAVVRPVPPVGDLLPLQSLEVTDCDLKKEIPL